MKLYFTIKELNPNNYNLTQEQIDNLTVLIERVSRIREAYGKPMSVSSGVRDLQYHIKIYTDNGIALDKIPMKSKHLVGAAVDIVDNNGEIKNWLKQNLHLLEDIGLWCESFDYTDTWVHFQIFPPKSGKRVFIP